MSRRKDDGFDLAWQGLVILPGLIGAWYGYTRGHTLHSTVIYGISAAIVGFIVISAVVYGRAYRLKRSGINQVDQMSGREFENYLGHLFRKQGYKVRVTKEIGDYGADLILERDGIRIVVQAKRHKNKVGIKAVQEVLGSIAYYKADVGWVVTNSGFTDAAIRLAKSNQVRLIGRKELIGVMLETSKAADPVKSGIESNEIN